MPSWAVPRQMREMVISVRILSQLAPGFSQTEAAALAGVRHFTRAVALGHPEERRVDDAPVHGERRPDDRLPLVAVIGPEPDGRVFLFVAAGGLGQQPR